MENSQNAQELLYQFRYLREQRDMLASQFDFISASLRNLTNTKTTVANLKDLKGGEEILLPIGGIINVKATIKNPEKVLVFVNQDVVIEKDIDSSIEFIDKLIEQHNQQIQFLQTQIQNLDGNIARMSQILQQAAPQQ
ncbi:MAG: prefoldin subunit alpha [Promethearchaeota archaeon]